ncbi:MAG: peptide chain release factor N(5)-glutamine methyltransferase [Candidatus Saccharibacteria bacterium]
MPVINEWLANSTRQLSDIDIPSARLDAEVILAFAIGKDRTYLHAYPDKIIDDEVLETANKSLDLRLKRTPIAYIIGRKEFYGRQFTVTPVTLIPRPESETIIDILKTINEIGNPLRLVDVGTGSGCLGITAKLEFPNLNVTLIDISDEALKIAAKNAADLAADVNIIHSNLLKECTIKPDIIIANLPYVDRNWNRSPETDHEPELALFADDNGQLIIKQLISEAKNMLNTGAHLIIEADPDQHQSLIEYAKVHDFVKNQQLDYILDFTKN